jgi:signal peptidase I
MDAPMSPLAKAAYPSTRKDKRNFIISLVALALFALLVIFLISLLPLRRVAGWHTYSISSAAMEPTVYNGDHVVVDTVYYENHPIQDGDIVAFAKNEYVLLKRVSAVGGETVEGKDDRLVRNGILLDEPYITISESYPATPEATFPSRTIKAGTVFVTGDNRRLSLDSRSDDYGDVSTADVVGKLIFIYGSSHAGQFGRRF